MATRPPSLSSRPLDLLYFSFFLIHLPASLLLGGQLLYPSYLVPSFISQLPKIYTQLSNDPLIGGAMGYTGQSNDFTWFKTFVFVEIFFQVPVFILGMRGLWNDSRSIYPLLLIYGFSTATCTLPCLTVLISMPTTSAQTVAAGAQSVTHLQRCLLLPSYLTFFFIPLLMGLDMTVRVANLIRTGLARTEKKSQ